LTSNASQWELQQPGGTNNSHDEVTPGIPRKKLREEKQGQGTRVAAFKVTHFGKDS
jgi:hypothetical protein